MPSVKEILDTMDYRITSYNVCYTKLLRLRQSRRVAAFRDFVQEEIVTYRRLQSGDAILG